MGLLGELSAVRGELGGCVPLLWFVLIGMVTCTLWTGVGLAPVGRGPGRRRRRPSTRVTAVPAMLLAMVWILVNGRMEGPVLVSFSLEHGVTTSDLAAIVAFVVGGWRLLLR